MPAVLATLLVNEFAVDTCFSKQENMFYCLQTNSNVNTNASCVCKRFYLVLVSVKGLLAAAKSFVA